jgi:hypothetical protein
MSNLQLNIDEERILQLSCNENSMKVYIKYKDENIKMQEIILSGEQARYLAQYILYNIPDNSIGE